MPERRFGAATLRGTISRLLMRGSQEWRAPWERGVRGAVGRRGIVGAPLPVRWSRAAVQRGSADLCSVRNERLLRRRIREDLWCPRDAEEASAPGGWQPGNVNRTAVARGRPIPAFRTYSKPGGALRESFYPRVGTGTARRLRSAADGRIVGPVNQSAPAPFARPGAWLREFVAPGAHGTLPKQSGVLLARSPPLGPPTERTRP